MCLTTCRHANKYSTIHRSSTQWPSHPLLNCIIKQFVVNKWLWWQLYLLLVLWLCYVMLTELRNRGAAIKSSKFYICILICISHLSLKLQSESFLPVFLSWWLVLRNVCSCVIISMRCQAEWSCRCTKAKQSTVRFFSCETLMGLRFVLF